METRATKRARRTVDGPPRPGFEGPFYKILAKDMIHNGFEYKPGLNVDRIPFNPDSKCAPGGLYFSDLENIHKFFGYGPLIARVTLPPDARVIRESKDKLKADKIILSDIGPIVQSSIFDDISNAINMLRHY